MRRATFLAHESIRDGNDVVLVSIRTSSTNGPLIYDQPIVLMQRQSGAAIEGMVRQRSSAELERIAVDTHGFTGFGMGVSKALGFDLCPRLRGVGRGLHVPRDVRVPDVLEPVIVRDISMEQIHAGWDEFVRLVASIEVGTV